MPGFATLFVPFGQWFVITDGARRALGMSLERGPASWTSRIIDLNYTLVSRLGYGPGPCHPSYPNGRVTATKIVRDLRYPSCGWAGRQVTIQLRKRIGRLGAPGTCLTGRRAAKLRSFQFLIRHPHAARSGTVDLGTYRALYRAG